MKRSGPPKRKKGLQADPEKVRAFKDRGRGALDRSSASLRRSETPKRGKPRPASPRPATGGGASLRQRVWEADSGRCWGCNRALARDAGIWSWHAHHPIPQQTLKARLGDRGWELCRETDSAMLLCKRCHERHETATERVPLAKVPGRCRDFAARLGPWAEDLLVLRHPTEPNPMTEEVT